MRLLRLAKLKVIFEKIEEIIQQSTVTAVVICFLKLCFFVLFCSHWLGSIFHFIGISEDENGILFLEIKSKTTGYRNLIYTTNHGRLDMLILFTGLLKR
jgi:hypothetical protein